MSKKPQPQKGDNNKNKIETVDQQNEPFLRALQKKVRNINKKLTEIADLQGKDNLKVEQIQKINRKDNLLEERSKIEQTATFFKEVYAENAAHYRAHQLKELEILARAVSIYHSGPKTPEQARLSALWRVLEQTDKTYPTLNIAITTLSNALKDFANDRKLQKALTTYVEEQGNNEIKTVEINQEKIVNDILQQKPAKQPTKKIEEVHKEEPVKAEPVKVEAVKVEPVKAEPVEVAKVEAVKVEQKPLQVVAQPLLAQTEEKPAPVQEAPKVTQAVVQQQATPITEPQTTPAATSDPKSQPAEKGEKRDYRNRDNRDNRDRPYRGRGGNYRGRGGEGEKRQYKPKYEDRQGEERPNRSASSSSSSSEQVRKFRREEISELQNDGFTVVGKPKPKAKDPKEALQAYDRTHGKKHHHHGHAKNS